MGILFHLELGIPKHSQDDVQGKFAGKMLFVTRNIS